MRVYVNFAEKDKYFVGKILKYHELSVPLIFITRLDEYFSTCFSISRYARFFGAVYGIRAKYKNRIVKGVSWARVDVAFYATLSYSGALVNYITAAKRSAGSIARPGSGSFCESAKAADVRSRCFPKRIACTEAGNDFVASSRRLISPGRRIVGGREWVRATFWESSRVSVSRISRQLRGWMMPGKHRICSHRYFLARALDHT